MKQIGMRGAHWAWQLASLRRNRLIQLFLNARAMVVVAASMVLLLMPICVTTDTYANLSIRASVGTCATCGSTARKNGAFVEAR